MIPDAPLPDEVLDQLPFALSVTRAADGKVLFVNALWETLFGHSRAEALGRNVFELGLYADQSQRAPLLNALENRGAARALELDLRRKDGETRTIRINANRIERGGESLILSTAEDITSRKASERALEVARDRFRRAIQDSGIGMAIYSATGKYLEVNDALSKMLGYPAEELLDLDWRTITHPDDVRPTEDVGQAMKTGSVIRLQKRYIRKDGSIVHVELTSSALREADGKVREFLTQIVDVTAKVAAEEEARKSMVTRRLARELLRHVGGALGEQGTRRELGRRLGRESGKQGLDAALGAFRGMGIGDLTLQSSESGRYEFESKDSLDVQPGSATPTCLLTLGFAEGLVTAVTGAQSLGAELRCQSQGHASCHIVVRSRTGPS